MNDSYYEQLGEYCDEAWQLLADSFSDLPDFIGGLFSSFLENPLCIIIVSVLFGTAAFYGLLSLFRVFVFERRL